MFIKFDTIGNLKVVEHLGIMGDNILFIGEDEFNQKYVVYLLEEDDINIFETDEVKYSEMLSNMKRTWLISLISENEYKDFLVCDYSTKELVELAEFSYLYIEKGNKYESKTVIQKCDYKRLCNLPEENIYYSCERLFKVS